MSELEDIEKLCPDCKGTHEYKYMSDSVDGVQITEPCQNDIHDPKLQQSIAAYTDRAVEKHLNWWKADIVSGFIPKCSFCDRKTAKVVGQITKGEYAQEHNHRPVNWGYYCQRCYDEGMERENEAMYG